MKRLDFSRIKKAPSGNYKLRRGGYEHYTHILNPINRNVSVVYRDFNKQKLPGCLFIEGKNIYRIEKNTHFAS